MQSPHPFHTTAFNNHYLATQTHAQSGAKVLFVHGGPGLHSGNFEAVVQALPELNSNNFNWVTYDQRECGRSPKDPPQKTPITHEQNIQDLLALVDHLNQDGKLIGVLGHSYGAGLTFDSFKKSRDLKQKLILVGRAQERRMPAKRSPLLDLFLLKLNHPKTYQELVAKTKDVQDLRDFADHVYNALPNRSERDPFYWYDLNNMAFYEQIKKSVGMCENTEIFKSVVSCIVTDTEAYTDFDISHLAQPVLWINGFHDFLMAGESYDSENSPIKVFYNSGHYPHIEEPARFMSEVESFLAFS